MKRVSTPWIVVTCILIGSCVLISTGCGKKAYPVSPGQKLLVQHATDLQARMLQGQVELVWTVPASPAVALSRFVVYKASRALSEGECKGCPLLFSKLSEWPVISSRSGVPVKMRVLDPVEPGYVYFYKVVGIDTAGLSGKDSNVAELAVP